MPVLVYRSGKEGTPDVCEKAVCWTMGPLTAQLWGDEAKTKLVCEFKLHEVNRFEYPETALKKYVFPKKDAGAQ